MRNIIIALSFSLTTSIIAAKPTDCILGSGSPLPRLSGEELFNTSVNDHMKRIELLFDREYKNYSDCLNLWNGGDVVAFMEMMGAPTQQSKLPNNEIVYVWQEENENGSCKTSIFTKGKKIRKWHATGSLCRRENPPQKPGSNNTSAGKNHNPY